MTAEGYSVHLRQLEQRVNELKERIFRSKARLNLLKETVLHGVIAGSRSLIMHKNDMGSSFRLIKLVYAVDGAQIYAKSDDSGGLDAKREFEIFNGIVPGNHRVRAHIFRGRLRHLPTSRATSSRSVEPHVHGGRGKRRDHGPRLRRATSRPS
jgi:hypothetical protein